MLAAADEANETIFAEVRGFVKAGQIPAAIKHIHDNLPLIESRSKESESEDEAAIRAYCTILELNLLPEAGVSDSDFESLISSGTTMIKPDEDTNAERVLQLIASSGLWKEPQGFTFRI